MIIELHFTGNERKELVKAVSEIIGVPAEYQYMPTCAYKIGDFYTVTKEGNLEISDSADGKEVEMLIDELVHRGYDVPLDEEENGLTVEMPLELVDDATIDRLRKIVENKGELFKAAFKLTTLKSSLKQTRFAFLGLPLKMMVMQMPTALSFPCSANLQRIRNVSTISLKPAIIPNTQCVVISFALA